MALLVGVLASLTLASACGNPKVVTPSPSPTVRTGYDRYLGWWSSQSPSELLADLIRVYKRGTTYILGGQLGAPLRLRDGRLQGTLSAGQGQVELRISANARHLMLRWTHDGSLWEKASFTSATSNEIDDFLTQQIYDRITGAVDTWGRKHGHYPPASALLPDGAVGRQLRPWPDQPLHRQADRSRQRSGKLRVPAYGSPLPPHLPRVHWRGGHRHGADPVASVRLRGVVVNP